MTPTHRHRLPPLPAPPAARCGPHRARAIPRPDCHARQTPALSCSYPDCDRQFLLQHHWSRHLLTHSVARPWRCCIDDCGARFRLHSALKRHMGSHMARTTPYACPYPGCSRSFRFKAQAVHHLLYHRPPIAPHSSLMPPVARAGSRMTERTGSVQPPGQAIAQAPAAPPQTRGAAQTPMTWQETAAPGTSVQEQCRRTANPGSAHLPAHKPAQDLSQHSEAPGRMPS